MSGMLHLKSMESISLYGLSDVRMYFDWDSDYEQDRIQTINQLSINRNVTPGHHARICRPKIQLEKSIAI